MSIKLPQLPKNTVTDFKRPGGLSTKKWGPGLWSSLFLMITGAYPIRINTKNPEHIKIRRAFVNMLCNLKYTLPCSFCRQSYIEFYKELPISHYTHTRLTLMYWLYLMKDKVNKKLIYQEKEYIKQQKKLTKNESTKLTASDNIKKCFLTIPSPPFVEVIKYYSQYRASCSKVLKKCI